MVKNSTDRSRIDPQLGRVMNDETELSGEEVERAAAIETGKDCIDEVLRLALHDELAQAVVVGRREELHENGNLSCGYCCIRTGY